MTALDCGCIPAADTYRRAARVLAWARDGHAAFPAAQKAAWRAGFDEASRQVLKALRPAECDGVERSPNPCVCDCEGCGHHCALHRGGAS